MLQINLGLQKDLDVSFYAKLEFDWLQMEQIRLGLEQGLDIDSYAKPEFDSKQMEQIRLDLEDGLDASKESIEVPDDVVKKLNLF